MWGENYTEKLYLKTPGKTTLSRLFSMPKEPKRTTSKLNYMYVTTQEHTVFTLKATEWFLTFRILWHVSIYWTQHSILQLSKDCRASFAWNA